MRILDENMIICRGGLYLPACASQWQAGAHLVGQVQKVSGRE